jgi:hypothetical protein
MMVKGTKVYKSGGGFTRLKDIYPMKGLEEFGYFLYDPEKPWQTMPLTGPYAMPVWDYFEFVDGRWNDASASVPPDAARGKVNINTDRPEALQAALTGAPVRLFVEPEKAFDTDVDAVSQALSAGISNATNLHHAFTLVPTNLTEKSTQFDYKWQVESVLGNTRNLISVRQNLFAVLLTAQQLASDGEVLAQKNALATVWRDPYPDEMTGVHRMKVLGFRWMNE